MTKFDELIEDIQTGSVDVMSIDFTKYNRLQNQRIALAIRARLAAERAGSDMTIKQLGNTIEAMTNEKLRTGRGLEELQQEVTKLGIMVSHERSESQHRLNMVRDERARALDVLRILDLVTRTPKEKRREHMARVAMTYNTSLQNQNDFDDLVALVELLLVRSSV